MSVAPLQIPRRSHRGHGGGDMSDACVQELVAILQAGSSCSIQIWPAGRGIEPDISLAEACSAVMDEMAASLPRQRLRAIDFDARMFKRNPSKLVAPPGGIAVLARTFEGLRYSSDPFQCFREFAKGGFQSRAKLKVL